ncbi:MAG: cupin domain-containing protein [Candidatus Obscuribacterales bacterium]|nr:cupin domain-containing protein [Candidatus Obscuribacterales bacterium]
MNDTTTVKVDSRFSPQGKDGQKYLACGKSLSMRLWLDEPSESKEPTIREYETVGYVLKGKAELTCEGQTISLTVGDSWVVPRGARHNYRIIESFSAIEATSPPAEVHNREASKGQPQSKPAELPLER